MDINRLNDNLSEYDKERVRKQTDSFRLGLRTSEVISTLLRKKDFFSGGDVSALNERRKDGDKAEYLVTVILTKVTYRHLEQFLKALLDTKHENLADRLSPIMIDLHQRYQPTPRGKRNRGKALHQNSANTTSTQRTAFRSESCHREGPTTGSTRNQSEQGRLIGHAAQVRKVANPGTTRQERQSSNQPHHAKPNGNSTARSHVPRAGTTHQQMEPSMDPAGPTSAEVSCEKATATGAQAYKSAASPRVRSGESTCQQEVGRESVVITRPATGYRQSACYEVQSSNPRGGDMLKCQQLTSELFNMVIDKDCAPYDFLKVVRTLKDKYPSHPHELVNREGLNILHAVVDSGRLRLLASLVQLGWWGGLSRMKVPQASSSQHRGLTAKEIVQRKADRDTLTEFMRAEDWDASLSCLMKVLRHNDRAVIYDKMSRSDGLHQVDLNNGNACYWAVVNGDAKLLEELVTKNVDVNMTTLQEENLLHIACLFDHHHMIRPLCQIYMLNPWATDSKGITPVDSVAQSGNVAALEAFLDCGVRPQASALTFSARYGRMEFLVYLIDRLRMDVNSTNAVGDTALHEACRNDRVDMVKYLLARGADVRKHNVRNENVLHAVARYGSQQVLQLLSSLTGCMETLTNRQNRFDGEEVWFPVAMPAAARNERNTWCQLEVDRQKRLAFNHVVAQGGDINPEYFGSIIKKGGRGLQPSEEEVAEIRRQYYMRRMRQQEADDMTPLHIAVLHGHDEIARSLLQHNAGLELRDKFGLSPLLLAVSCGREVMVRELVRRGANTKVVSYKGEDCLNLADMNQQHSIKKMIWNVNLFNGIQGMQKDIQAIDRGIAVNSVDRPEFHHRNQRQQIDRLRAIHQVSGRLLQDIDSGPVTEDTEKPAEEIRRQQQLQRARYYHTA